MIVTTTSTALSVRASQPGYRVVQRVFLATSVLLGPLIISLLLASQLPIPWLLAIGLLPIVCFLPFGMLGMTMLALRRSPWLAMSGGVLALTGFIAYAMIVLWQEELLYHSAVLGGGALLTTLYAQMNADPVMNALLLVFIIGHLIGPMLLGIAMGRTHLIPLWAMGALILRVPLQAAGFLAGIGLTMEIFTYGLLFVACIPVAQALWSFADER